jgi:predicted RNA-binding protein with PUA-like domain
MANAKNYWLVKSEPDCFSIHDLARRPGKTIHWDGVRNYQARNFMRDGMHVGDGVLFYHSSAEPPSIAGTAVVARAAYPDFTAFDPQEGHFDPKSTAENPIWMMVDIRLDEIFPRPLSLNELRGVAALEGMELLRRGSRLSVQPVTKGQFETVLKLAHATPAPVVKSPAKNPPVKAAAAKPTAKKQAKAGGWTK